MIPRRTPLSRGTPPKRKSWLKRGTKRIPKFNAKRIARKAKAYAKVMASAFHKELRYKAYLRSEGLCECRECATLRKPHKPLGAPRIYTAQQLERFGLAWTPIPVWFVATSGTPAKRFRSSSGELHHKSYTFFGDENPAELEHVLWVWKECHKRIEAEHGTRRHYLTSSRAA